MLPRFISASCVPSIHDFVPDGPGTTTIGTSGADRIDNLLFPPDTILGIPLHHHPTAGRNSDLLGRCGQFDSGCTGTSPTYQWYYPDMNHPLSDGNSGYGVGYITNTATSIADLWVT